MSTFRNVFSLSRRVASGLLAATALTLALAGIASAGEVRTGGGGGVKPSVCNPVSGLVVKTDTTTGETGLGSLQASYSVKPCVNGQTLTVTTKVSEYYTPSVVTYENPGAALSGKFSVFGIRTRVLYTVSVTAIDASTGSSAGTLSTVVAAIPKGV